MYVFDVVSSQLENAINVLQPPGYSGGNAATATGKEIIGIIHADMIVSENYLENLLKHLDKGKVVCATRIEPPLVCYDYI